MTGGVVSTIVTVWLQVLVLPQQSLASQVRVTTCGQIPVFVTVSTTAITFVQQLSLTVGASNVQFEPHSTVLFVAHVIVGGVLSTTETTCVQVAVIPRQSVRTKAREMFCGQVPLVESKVMKVYVVQQGSTIVGRSNSQAEPQSTVLLGAQIRTGGGQLLVSVLTLKA